ncbi:putative aminotransferase [Aliivibrio salmonicida LFI1238]|uniref:Aminotransferase n=1 Tax=Aliivibrio salmonicida (strain LFI1238) TaxID=316275 RepID=B6ENL1_ALISL|nr:putative aminotransferase [Aliivibrio salmonicida LFI1238]
MSLSGDIALNKYLLLTPGPVNVANNVRMAIAKEDICHREVDFDLLLAGIEQKLLNVFEIKAVDDYRAVVITGSGTAANEAMLSSVVGDKKILVLSNGEFGDRLHEISKIHNQNTSVLEFPWGQSLDINIISDYLEHNSIDVIAMVHHETSSGILNSLEQIGTLAKIHNAKFIVDCVSSAGAEAIDVKRNNIDFFSSSSSKALGSYPGLSFVIGKTTEFEKLKNYPIKTAYLNLYKFYTFLKTVSQTPNTPAVPLFFALDQALSNILEQGVANRYADLRSKANFLRSGMQKLGFNFLLHERDMCSILTSVYVPADIDVDVLRQKLRDKSIIIYEGKGCFKHKVFQVGNIGEISFEDIQFFLDIQKEILQSSNILESHKLISLPKIRPLINKTKSILTPSPLVAVSIV